MASAIPRGPRQIIQAAGYSAQGLRAAWKFEASFRAEIYLVAGLIPVAFWLGRSIAEVGLLLAVLFLVPTVELLNSAIEAVVDRVCPGPDELAGRAKDMGSAAVSGSLLVMAIVWSALAIERFLR